MCQCKKNCGASKLKNINKLKKLGDINKANTLWPLGDFIF
jgi:hypothetical protein